MSSGLAIPASRPDAAGVGTAPGGLAAGVVTPRTAPAAPELPARQCLAGRGKAWSSPEWHGMEHNQGGWSSAGFDSLPPTLGRPRRGEAQPGPAGLSEAWSTTGVAAHTGVRVSGPRAGHGIAELGPAWLGWALHAVARPGKAWKHNGRTAYTEVQVLRAHARPGLARPTQAGLGMAGPGMGSRRAGGSFTEGPIPSALTHGVDLHCWARCGVAKHGWVRLGMEAIGRLAATGVQGPSVYARPGMTGIGAARHGAAGLGQARYGEARHGSNGGWLASTEVQALGTHSERGQARPGEVWHGQAWHSGAGQGMEQYAGGWQALRFEPSTSTHVARSARPSKARPGAVRLGAAQAGTGNARRGNAGLSAAWKADDWQTSGFKSPTSTANAVESQPGTSDRGVTPTR